MGFLNYRVFVDDKLYRVVQWSEDFIIVSRKFESMYIELIKYKRKDVVIIPGSRLRDKKGNEIFSGDIVRNSDKDIGIVRFKDAAFEVDFKNYIPALLGLINDDLEIIGNVYENNKLLDKVIDKTKKVICMNKVEKRLSRKRKRTSKRRSMI